MARPYPLLVAALLSQCGFAAFASAPVEPEISIEWDRSSARPVQSGGYGRARLLRSGNLMLVYSDGPAAYARTSRDRGATWAPPVKVAEHEGWFDTNCELIELDNGWLVYGLNSRPTRANEGRLPYVIRTLISRDHGQSWSDEREVFVGGKLFHDGCWEPAFLKLPSGELQLYFANEAPYTRSDEQEISIVRSLDRGLTWSKPSTVSFRAGKRDGMPVPVLLRDSQTIVCAIEDDGYDGEFKPVTVRTSLEANWSDGPVLADSPHRLGALRSDIAPASAVYLGAPYLAQLPSGETLLVVQSAEGRSPDRKHPVPVVYISARDARNFCRPTSPFDWLPSEAAGEWNSLTVIDETTVMLITTVSRYPEPTSPTSLWTIMGRMVRSQ